MPPAERLARIFVRKPNYYIVIMLKDAFDYLNDKTFFDLLKLSHPSPTCFGHFVEMLCSFCVNQLTVTAKNIVWGGGGVGQNLVFDSNLIFTITLSLKNLQVGERAAWGSKIEFLLSCLRSLL